jgi:protein-L-isoaspartate(D-aspartate) O-methyltransferase
LLAACAAPKPPSPARAPLPTPRDEDWPMFRDDVERSGFAEGSVVGAAVDRIWQIPSFNVTRYGAAKGSPSVVGDLLFCGTDTGRFLAARVSDGSIVWQVQLERTSHGIHGSPAIVGDTVYIGAYDGNVYAFERATGLLKWRRRVGYQVGSSPAVVPEWAALFSSHEEADGTGYVVALDARSGDQLWQRRTLAHPHSSVAVDVKRGLVFVGDNLGVIYAFDAHSGTEKWRRELDRDGGKADIKTTPTVIPELGRVVFGAWSGKVYALDEASGATAWEHAAGGKIMGSTAYLPATGTVFAGSPDGRLYALDAKSGAPRWQHEVRARIMSSPAVSGDGRAVVFGASDGRVYALRTSDGSELWSTWVGGHVSGSPTLVGRRIYVTSMRGSLWALETRDGAAVEIDPESAKQARAQLVETMRAQGWVRDLQVIDAVARVPRHRFLGPSGVAGGAERSGSNGAATADAYADRPLPIAHGQTISQPSVVAKMTEALALDGTQRVLEIGTGSGYQAAVLSLLAAHVYSIEIVPELAVLARERLHALGYDVYQRIGDGYRGWPEEAPFDRILMTAAPPEVPPALLGQLADGGILVAPIGEADEQRLVKFTRRGGTFDREDLGPIRFVPMVHAPP